MHPYSWSWSNARGPGCLRPLAQRLGASGLGLSMLRVSLEGNHLGRSPALLRHATAGSLCARAVQPGVSNRHRAKGCQLQQSRDSSHRNPVCPRQRRGCTPQLGCQRDTSLPASQRGEQQVVPSVATSQNYVETCMHTHVRTLTHLFTLTSSPLHLRRVRAQLYLAGRRLSARPGDVVAQPGSA